MNRYSQIDQTSSAPQVKICGITSVEDALFCADFGADAIGFVFYKKSPRYISPDQVKIIIGQLPEKFYTVGVFVDEPAEDIAKIVTACGLGSIQLHGKESPKEIEKLFSLNIPIIKALYMKGEPSIENVSLYNATSYLVECQRGELPGGNAITWKWEEAYNFGVSFPLILAGGLSPDNVAEAILAAQPDAIDASSGVEISPGKKDMQKVEKFIHNVKKSNLNKKLRKIFHESSR